MEEILIELAEWFDSEIQDTTDNGDYNENDR
jgi:hypothetical protein